jgi:hypothetical protein
MAFSFTMLLILGIGLILVVGLIVAIVVLAASGGRRERED